MVEAPAPLQQVVLVMLRFGFFTLVVTLFVINWPLDSLVTTDFGAWYPQSSWLVLALPGGMAVWGFRCSLGGRPLFAESTLER